MHLEATGFDAPTREARAVYARRIAVFPSGSLMAYIDDVCVGCLFAEIWPAKQALTTDDFALGHDIAARHDPAGSELYVASMTVSHEHRGHGLGHRLFNEAILRIGERYPGIESVLLLVNETWHGARAIYLKSGFVELQRLPGFFAGADGTRQDGIVMRKRPIVHRA